jgi:hypothetical protein
MPLDPAVELCVLAIGWIVRIDLVLLRGHLIGARLGAAADALQLARDLLFAEIQSGVD